MPRGDDFGFKMDHGITREGLNEKGRRIFDEGYYMGSQRGGPGD